MYLPLVYGMLPCFIFFTYKFCEIGPLLHENNALHSTIVKEHSVLTHSKSCLSATMYKEVSSMIHVYHGLGKKTILKTYCTTMFSEKQFQCFTLLNETFEVLYNW